MNHDLKMKLLYAIHEMELCESTKTLSWGKDIWAFQQAHMDFIKNRDILLDFISGRDGSLEKVFNPEKLDLS